jgi:hypothetical protein
MARFYDPLKERPNQPVDTKIGYKGRLDYDPRLDAGSSGGDVTDLTPERNYDVDTRRLDAEEKNTAAAADTANVVQQNRVRRFLKAANLASKYQQSADVQSPIFGTRVPQGAMSYKGTELPSLGDSQGARGSVNYPTKPQFNSGKPYNYSDYFG